MTINPLVMAWAALGVSFVTMLMVLLDSFIDLRAWFERGETWKTQLVEATAVTSLGSLEVEQRARAFESGAVGFFERAHRSTIQGQAVVNGETVELVAGADAQVWVSRQAMEQAAQYASASEFAEMFEKSKGTQALRTVRVEVTAGSKVFIAGVRDGSCFVATLVSTVDPRAELRARVMLNLGLSTLNFVWFSVGALLAVWNPAFGTVSIVGACILLGHFLGITPLAVDVRERSKTPAERALLGTWEPPRAGASVSNAV